MRKLLLPAILLGMLCLWSCTNTSADDATTPKDSSATVTTPVIQYTDDQTTRVPVTTAPDDVPTTDGTTTFSETQKIPETVATTAPITVPQPESTTSVGTPTTEVNPTPGTTTTQATTTTKATTTKPQVTTKPVTTADPLLGKTVTVRYVVNDSKGGSLSGTTVQNIRIGETKTTLVFAKAQLGYRFVGWSDGNGNTSRSGDCPRENTTYTAIFEYDTKELPVISITTSTGSDVTSKVDYIGGTIAISNCDAAYILETMDMEIRGRGNFSWRTEKKSYRIKLSKKQNLLGQGEGKAKSWTLIANHCDQSLIRNYITLNYARKLENLTFMSSAISVDLYLNGQYRGVYTLCEQNQVHEYRVNIAENPYSVQTGYLIEMSNYAEENVFHAGGRAYETKNDLSPDSELYNKQQAYIANIVQTCWDAVQRGDRAEIERLLDIPSVVDAYIVEELFKNKDDGWDSFYMYYDATVTGEKLHFGPIWDFDLTGGNADDGCENYEGLWAGISGQMQDNGWFITLLRYSWFRGLVAERWNELKVETDKIPAAIIAEAERGFNAYSRNFEKWKIFGQRINLEPPQVTALKSYTEHYQYYSNWMKNRIDWLDGYFNDPSYAFDGSLSLEGEGTAESPYLVSKPEDLLMFNLCILDGQSFAGTYFRQTANLDMTNVKGYTGVGEKCTFAGVYDGAGYTIRATFSGYDSCIFPYVTGTVMNLFTEGSIQNSNHASGICRSVRRGGKIINCGSSMTLSAERTGGIANSNEAGGGMIAGCVFTGTISGSISVSPINCYNDGRGGTFYGNYYLPGLPHNTAQVDPTTPKNESELAAASMAEALNGNLGEVASLAGVDPAKLCQWTTQNGSPVLLVK